MEPVPKLLRMPRFQRGDDAAPVESFRTGSWRGYSSGRIGPASANRTHVAAQLDGDIDVGRLLFAFDALIERHPVTRASACEVQGRPMLSFLGKPRLKIERAVPGASLASVISHLATDVWRPFSLENDILFRAGLKIISSEKCILYMVSHHIVSDAQSISLIWREFWKIYNGLPISEKPISYGDYLRGMQIWRLSEAASTQLARAIEVLRPAIETFVDRSQLGGPPTVEPISIGLEVITCIRRAAAQAGVTVFCMLLAVQIMMLAQSEGRDHVTIAGVISGREAPQLQGVAGYFADRHYYSVFVGDRPTFGALVKRTWAAIADATSRSFVRSDFLRDALFLEGQAVVCPGFNFTPLGPRPHRPLPNGPAPRRLTVTTINSPYSGNPTPPGVDVRNYWLELRENFDGLSGKILHVSARATNFTAYLLRTCAEIASREDLCWDLISLPERPIAAEEATVGA